MAHRVRGDIGAHGELTIEASGPKLPETKGLGVFGLMISSAVMIFSWVLLGFNGHVPESLGVQGFRIFRV